MFKNSNNFTVYGGNFSATNIRNSERHLIVRRTYPMKPFPARSGLDILRDSIATGAFHNSSERYDPPKCYPRTRLAVLEHIMDWIKNDRNKSPILWIYGPAGAGKSAIAQTIAEMCERLEIVLVASFFWSQIDPNRNDATRLIASLACQLLVAIPQMRNHVETVIENDPFLLTRSLMTQMESLIIDPLSKTFSDNQEQILDAGKVRVIILDGLDECGDPKIQAYILEVISTAIQKFPIHIRFLIASRPEQEIRNSFNSQPLLSITERLALDDRYQPDNDIRIYFTDSFNSLKKSHVLGRFLPAHWPTLEDIETLVQKSSGQFIYASTVLKFVKSPRRRPDEQLNIILRIHGAEKHTPFAELDTLYVRVFSMVEDFSRVLEILSCLFFLQSEMHVHDIENLLSYNHGDIHLILSDLHSILDVPDVTDKRPIHVFHACLQDFLLDQNRSGPFYLDEGIARARLTQICMRHIRNIPPETESGINVNGRMDYFMVEGLRTNFLRASPTIDLLRELLNFDFETWLSASYTYIPSNGFWLTVEEKAFSCFEEIIQLSTWFQRQESIVKKPVTESETILYAQRSHTRDMAINWLLEKALCLRNTSNEIRRRLEMAAITHPLLWDSQNRSVMLNLHFYVLKDIDEKPHISNHRTISFYDSTKNIQPECISELQQFLRNRSRAGRCYVNSEMYSCLSLRIWKFIVQENDMPSDDRILQLAIETLPFYLSNGNYESELVDSFLSSEVHLKRLEGRYQHVEALQEAISLYLNRKSPAKVNRLRVRRKHRRP